MHPGLLPASTLRSTCPVAKVLDAARVTELRDSYDQIVHALLRSSPLPLPPFLNAGAPAKAPIHHRSIGAIRCRGLKLLRCGKTEEGVGRRPEVHRRGLDRVDAQVLCRAPALQP